MFRIKGLFIPSFLKLKDLKNVSDTNYDTTVNQFTHLTFIFKFATHFFFYFLYLEFELPLLLVNTESPLRNPKYGSATQHFPITPGQWSGAEKKMNGQKPHTYCTQHRYQSPLVMYEKNSNVR